MLKRILIILIGLIPSLGVAQKYRNPVIDNGVIYGMSIKAPDLTGSVYLNDDWRDAVLYLKKGAFSADTISNVSVKLDLKTNTFEIFTDKNIKILPGAKVAHFTWLDPSKGNSESYNNCDEFSFEGSKLNGFCKVLSDNGNVFLVEHQYIELIEADYNVQLSVGNKDDRIVKRERLYLISDNRMMRYEKKTLYSLMGEKSDQIKKYIRENGLNISKRDDLKQVVDYYNSI